MFRRVLATAPASAGKLVASAARPQIASPLLQRTPATGAAVVARRSYHEKDDQTASFFAESSSPLLLSHLAPHTSLLDHYNRPRNVGSMSKNDGDVGTGLVGAPACGDVMKLQIRVDPDSNTISDVKFKTFGCGSAIASSSYLTELVRGMTLEQAARIKNTEIAKELCLPPVKLHCSMLAEDAIKSAISNYYTKNPKARATDLGGTGAPLPKVEVETITESPKATAASANA
ncbi:iron sulfur cluster assembly protein-like protein 1 [Phyllosticta paracitricarpa]|uniref:Iron-sulfur cluster assembly protein n=1 Tax=Phyllosticta paracitricarpa TaxID=2016321 RepID=A0ABR1N333_9PEZI